MRPLCDYVLKAGEEEIPVSAPVRGDLRPCSSRSGHAQVITLGFAAQDARAARKLVGHDVRLVANLQTPGRDLGRFRILEVDAPMALLVAEALPGTLEGVIAAGDAVVSAPGTRAN